MKHDELKMILFNINEKIEEVMGDIEYQLKALKKIQDEIPDWDDLEIEPKEVEEDKN